MNAAIEKKCVDLVDQQFKDVESDFTRAMEYFTKCEDRDLDEGGRLGLGVFYKDLDLGHNEYEDFFDYVNNYGLSWDYVEKGTFDDQERGFFRYQLSWGGPSSEFRIYADYDKSIDFIEFWYMDWFDGASVEVDSGSTSYYVCEMFMELEL